MSESRETNVGRIESPDLVPVRVAYTVERTVYVYAFSAAEARRNARDTRDWADADDPNERMDTVRILRNQTEFNNVTV